MTANCLLFSVDMYTLLTFFFNAESYALTSTFYTIGTENNPPDSELT